MENRKTQIVDLALKLIQEKGYVAISYDDLAKHLGVTKASIHYHFEKKEDLGVAVTERLKQNLQEFHLSLTNSSKTVEEKISHFASRRIKQIADGICPISSLQTDFESLPHMLREKVQEVSRLELTIMVQILSEATREESRPGSEDIEALSLTILSAIKGAQQYQRVVGKNILPKVLDQLSRIIKK